MGLARMLGYDPKIHGKRAKRKARKARKPKVQRGSAVSRRARIAKPAPAPVARWAVNAEGALLEIGPDNRVVREISRPSTLALIAFLRKLDDRHPLGAEA
jgi:hypothetical protein